MGVDYGEILCTAVDEIVTARLQGLSYDITKLCTIVDDSQSYQGKYVVSDGTARYEAYTTDNNLQKGNNVLVTIPNGDYKLQKIIKGRVATTDTTPFKYESPLSKMVKVTENILETGITESNREEKGLTANSSITYLKKPIYSIEKASQLSGYTRLGISADFRSLLNGYDVVSGTYGLKVLIQGNVVTKPGVTTPQVYELNFNSDDMVGNPYQFEIPFSQEKVFDISFINSIDTIQIYFYQGNNFVNGSGERISSYFYSGISGKDESVSNNLFVDNVQLFLGYDVNEFKGETLMIHTDDLLSYQYKRDSNEKNMFLRWIHFKDGESPTIVPANGVGGVTGKEVHWYRYVVGTENVDKYGGKNWEEIPSDVAYGQLKCVFTPDVTKQTEQIKAVGIIKEQTDIADTPKEQIYYSNLLIFENEEKVPDQTTKDASMGLSIECLDGSEGNYFVYNQNGKINNEGLGQGYERKFKAMFNGAEITSDIGTLDWIKWYIPAEGRNKTSMILLNKDQRKENDGDVPNESAQYRNNDYWIITRKPKEDKEAFTSNEQSYSISSQWTRQKNNNFVICKVSIDGVEYEATKQLNFGKAGTNGTNLTLVMEFVNNQNALIINDNQNEKDISNNPINNTINVNTYLYSDSDGQIQPITDTNSIEYSWYKTTTDENNQDKGYITLSREKVKVKDKQGQEITQYKDVEATLECNISTIPSDNYYILQAVYNGKLTAYLPIPLKTRATSFIEGAREIIYDHQGIPSYYTGRYRLHYFDEFQQKYVGYEDQHKKQENTDSKQEDTESKKESVDSKEEDIDFKNESTDSDWKLISKPESTSDKISESYRPKLKEISPIDGWGLSAPLFFAENFKNNVCVFLDKPNFIYYKKNEITGENEAEKEVSLGWSQPILMMQSKYDFALLNEWDGSLTLNEKDGTILSTMLGAGRKNNDDNTFSGVLIGDVKAGTGLNSVQEATGIYGIHKGQLSYGFRDDGTGFIGKAGKGQILLDGNKSYIRNAGYLSDGTGMQIDLDQGIIDIKNKGATKIYISPNSEDENAYFTVKGSQNTLIHIDDNNYYLQSNNYRNDENGKQGSYFDLVGGMLMFGSSNGNIILRGDSSNDNPFLLVNTTDMKTGQDSPILKFSSTEQFLKSPPTILTTQEPETIQNEAGTNIYNIYKTKAGIDTDKPTNRLTLVEKNDDGSNKYRTINYYGISGSDYSKVIINYNQNTKKYSIEGDITEKVYTSDSIYLVTSNAEQVNKIIEEAKGLNINLKTGYIQGYDLTLKGRKSETSDYFLLDSTADTYPFEINGNNFRVSWSGDLYCNKVKSLTNDGSGKVISITNNFQVNSSGQASGTGCNFGGSFNGGFSGTGALSSMSLGGKAVSTKKIDIGQPTWKVNTKTIDHLLTKYSLYGPLTDAAGQTFYAFSSNNPKGQASVESVTGTTRTGNPDEITVLIT